MFKYWVFSGPYFSIFGLNTEIYSGNLRIESKCRKIRTRKNSLFGHFSRSETELFFCYQTFSLLNTWFFTSRKVSKYVVFSGPYFHIFGLNTEIYFVNLCIQSEYRKIQTRNNPVFVYFSRSEEWSIQCLFLVSRKW